MLRLTETQDRLAYRAEVNACAYGDGVAVLATFCCATEAQARELIQRLKAFDCDPRPDWGSQEEAR